MLRSSEKKIRVLIVDDSSFMRMAIRGVLNRDPQMEIVGTACNGAEGVAKAAELRPDIITMDVEMPVMDGITAVRRIMATAPTRVIMCSTLTCAGATATFEALEAGAIDYVLKHTAESGDAQEQFRSDLLCKVREAVHASVGRTAGEPPPPATPPPATHAPAEKTAPAGHLRRIKYVAIGASTGGPIAVQEVLSQLPANFPYAIIVAIHMPKAFTGPYAARLNSKCRLSVSEAIEGELLRPGRVLIAPGGVHTLLVKRADGVAVHLVAGSEYPRNFYVPSVDLMIESLADAANGSILGVILTGMGNDGFKGMQQLKKKGGMTVVQDEATSTVYGMPRACVEGGIADEILPLTRIGAAIGRTAG